MFTSSSAIPSNPLASVFDNVLADGVQFSALELPKLFSAGMGDRFSRQTIQDLADRIQNSRNAAEDLDNWLKKNKEQQAETNQDFLLGTRAIAGLQAKPTGKGGGGTSGGDTSGGGTAADLVVNRLSLDQTSLNAGDSLTVSVAIANQGNSNAGSSQTGFYLSRDQILDGSDQLLGTANLGSLRKGKSVNQSFSTTLAQDLGAGTYYVIAKADNLAGITESNENNNFGVQSIQIKAVGQADLVSQNLTIDNLVEGSSDLSVSYQIANLGNGDAATSIANLYLSNDAVFDNQDSLLGTVGIEAIGAGGSSQQAFNRLLDQSLTAGTYYVFVQSDGADQILESNETNNLSVASFTVTAPEPPPVADNWFTQNLQDSGLKLLGSSLGADNFLSRQDMIQLFTNSQDNGAIDATELADLGLILTNGKTLFGMENHVFDLSDKVLNGDTANLKSGIGNLSAGGSSTQMGNLIDKWFLGKDRPDTGYQYNYAAGSLVINGLSVDDVSQGNVGDCYFWTSLSSIAENQGQFLQEMFIDNGDNTFTVKFYEPNGDATYVTVDRYLPSSQGKFVYANTGDTLTSGDNELWVALAEKAYAQLAESGWSRPALYNNPAYNTNSYQAIDTGWMNEAIAALTNLKTYNYQLSASAGLTEANLLSLLNSDRLLTIGFGAGQGVVWDNHAYSINGYNALNQTFHLDNSWGYGDVDLTFSQLKTLGGRLQYTA